MDAFQEDLHLAKKELGIAEYMMSITVGLVKNKYILFSAIEHVDSALNHAVREFLNRKKLSYVPSDRYLLFDLYMRDYANDKNFISTIRDVQRIVKAKKDGEKVFERDSKLVIITSNFDILTIDEAQTKNYIRAVRQFISGALR